MSAISEFNPSEYFKKVNAAGTLRFITCGSVDDGKSTVIGRLLLDSKNVFEDQLSAIQMESTRYGTQGETPDLALLVDGLQAEREQGITIDVAYRYFSTDKRRYIVADTPGHKQYTRNMATGASTADLAVILIDARKGILEQTSRHSRIVSMMGVKHVVLAVNKMDLVEYSENIFLEITTNYLASIEEMGFSSVEAIPVSGLKGDNIFVESENMAWYEGPTLIEHLDTVDIHSDESASPFRMQVQWVNRLDTDFRGFCGVVDKGTLVKGAEVVISPSSIQTKVKTIFLGDKEVDEVSAGSAAQLVFDEEIDISRGDVVSSLANRPILSDQFCAKLLWTDDKPMQPGRQYKLKLGYKEVKASITEIKYLEDVSSGSQLATKNFQLNDIGMVNISVSEKINIEPYSNSRQIGSFILVDLVSNQTVAAGMVEHVLRRSTNIHWQRIAIGRGFRSLQKSQTSKCVWLTGLSGAGKSTIANIVDQKLSSIGKHVYILDGDNVRHGLNRDLGFTETDRVENVRRVSEVAKLFVDAGLIVIVSFISPFRSERKLARSLFDDGDFIEVFVDTSIDECEKRDIKGLYAKARQGDLLNFTGIDSPYEPPVAPEVHVKTEFLSAEECADTIVEKLM